jgi:hypothetical protein
VPDQVVGLHTKLYELRTAQTCLRRRSDAFEALAREVRERETTDPRMTDRGQL